MLGAVHHLCLEPTPGTVVFTADFMQAAVRPPIFRLIGPVAVQRGTTVLLAVCVGEILFPVPGILVGREDMRLTVFPPSFEVSGLVARRRFAVVIDAKFGVIPCFGVHRYVGAAVVVARVSLAAVTSGLIVGPSLVAAANGAAVVEAEDGPGLAVSISRAAGYLAGVIATVVVARLPVSPSLVAAGDVASVMRAIG